MISTKHTLVRKTKGKPKLKSHSRTPKKAPHSRRPKEKAPHGRILISAAIKRSSFQFPIYLPMNPLHIPGFLFSVPTFPLPLRPQTANPQPDKNPRAWR